MALVSEPTATTTLVGLRLAPGERTPFGVVHRVEAAGPNSECESCGQRGALVVRVTFVDQADFVVCSPCYSATIRE